MRTEAYDEIIDNVAQTENITNGTIFLYIHIDNIKKNLTFEIKRFSKDDFGSFLINCTAASRTVLRQTEHTSKHITQCAVQKLWNFRSTDILEVISSVLENNSHTLYIIIVYNIYVRKSAPILLKIIVI